MLSIVLNAEAATENIIHDPYSQAVNRFVNRQLQCGIISAMTGSSEYTENAWKGPFHGPESWKASWRR